MECLHRCVETSGWWALLAPLLAWLGYFLVSRLTAMVPPDYTYTTAAGTVVPVGLFWHRFLGNGPLAVKAIEGKP